jgi:hypothetical protein
MIYVLTRFVCQFVKIAYRFAISPFWNGVIYSRLSGAHPFAASGRIVFGPLKSVRSAFGRILESAETRVLQYHGPSFGLLSEARMALQKFFGINADAAEAIPGAYKPFFHMPALAWLAGVEALFTKGTRFGDQGPNSNLVSGQKRGSGFSSSHRLDYTSMPSIYT